MLGALVLPRGIFSRSSLPATLERAAERAAATAAETAEYRRALVLALPMLASTTISYAIFNYMTTYAVAILHMPQGEAFGATIAWGGAGLVFNLLGGALSDRWGRKPLMIWPKVLFVAMIIPGFAWIVAARSAGVLIGVTIALSAVASLSNGVSLVCLAEAIPKSVRSGSLAILYAVAIAVFNGTAQLLVTWLIRSTGDVLWPAYYLTGATVVGIAAMAMMRETAPRIVAPNG